MDHAHDTESDDDLDARLAKVFEERGIANPPPRPVPRALPPPPVAKVDAPAPVAKVDAPAPRPQALPQVLPQTLPQASPRPAPLSQALPRPAPVAHKPAPPPVAPRRSSRREKTILLAMLGTLAGAFVGVLSMKLFVPRAPNGAGPDIQLESVGSGGVDLVDPPVLTALPPTAAIPPDPFRSLGLPPAAPGDEKTALHSGETSAGDASDQDASAVDADRAAAALAAGRYSRRPATDRLTPIAATDLAPVPADATPPASRFAGNPLRAPGEAFPPARRPAFAGAPDRSDPREGVVPTAATGPLDPRSASEGAAAPSAGGGYVVQEGDTWWSVAESTYGDGRLYKALFAWNRTLDQRVSLAPGTRLELPREEQLRAAWGRLVPTADP